MMWVHTEDFNFSSALYHTFSLNSSAYSFDTKIGLVSNLPLPLRPLPHPLRRPLLLPPPLPPQLLFQFLRRLHRDPRPLHSVRLHLPQSLLHSRTPQSREHFRGPTESTSMLNITQEIEIPICMCVRVIPDSTKYQGFCEPKDTNTRGY